jgi:Predicted transcriptional regulator containing an HTH domain and an uncharacterized domain shared with the mammalian protein Schlafen
MKNIDAAVAKSRTLTLVEDLLALPAEASWAEFKENNKDPQLIGKLISALSNAARFAEQDFAYVLWGVRDSDRAVVGTSFEPSKQVEQQEPLDFWLSKRLRPCVQFSFMPIDCRGKRLVLLEIPAATSSPVEFDKTAYIRIGSATPRLSDHTERLKSLWAKLQPYAWENGVAAQFLTSEEVLERLDYSGYFDLTKQPLPDNRAGIFEKLAADRLVQRDVGGHWNITNLGAILFAKNLNDFPLIARKAIRFVAYDGPGRDAKITHRRDETKGYASGFAGLIEYMHGLLPSNEHIGKVFRMEDSLYPSIAIRELAVNAVIHQDMTITGAGPLIEMFKDRIEITNPGQPLVKPERFLDFPPRSRNEALASLMRRMRFCEEQGTGIDKVLAAAELYQLPAPDFQAEGDSTRVILFAPRSCANMTKDERIRACYQHAALKYISGQRMKNSTLCERLGIDLKNAAQVSNIIRKAITLGVIKPADPESPRAGYVPFWAREDSSS